MKNKPDAVHASMCLFVHISHFNCKAFVTTKTQSLAT